MALLPHILIETGAAPRYSIIWLHGLGADGSDFVPITEEMELPVPVRYIFPHAPKRPVTINGGFVMRAWYDIVGASIGERQDEAGMRASQAEIEKFIAHEKARGIAAENIYLAGFSQGGAIVLLTGLRHAERLGGIIALSTYLPLSESLKNEGVALETPVFMAHGTSDPIVPYVLGEKSAEYLRQLGYPLEWRDYDMPHSVCLEEINDIEHWLAQRLKPQ